MAIGAVQKSVPCWEVSLFHGGSLSEVPLIYITTVVCVAVENLLAMRSHYTVSHVSHA